MLNTVLSTIRCSGLYFSKLQKAWRDVLKLLISQYIRLKKPKQFSWKPVHLISNKNCFSLDCHLQSQSWFWYNLVYFHLIPVIMVSISDNTGYLSLPEIMVLQRPLLQPHRAVYVLSAAAVSLIYAFFLVIL